MTDVDTLMALKRELHDMVELHCKRWYNVGCTNAEVRKMLEEEADIRGRIKKLEENYG